MENKKLYELSEGDRFYFASDRRRLVWQVDRIEPQKEEYWPYRPYIRYYLVDDAQKKKVEKNDVAVVWIRNVLY